MTDKQILPEIAPCPFCHHVDDQEVEELDLWRSAVTCGYCAAQGPPVKRDDYVGAIEAWNNRTP